MPRLTFRLRMAALYTGFMTVIGLIALLARAPEPALWVIAALWLWFAKAFWFYRRDYGYRGQTWRDQWIGVVGDRTPEEAQKRLRRIWA